MRVVPFDLPPGAPVLVAGAGGGFDVVCGLPVALELEHRGHPVHLANYSFTALKEVRGGTWHGEHLLEVTADSTLEGDYFPEGHLAQWRRCRQNGSHSGQVASAGGGSSERRAHRR